MGMKKKTPSARKSEEELPFSFQRAVIPTEKINEHWERIASKMAPRDDVQDPQPDQSADHSAEGE